MSYGKNTNWENEKKYLDNLAKTGNPGEKAWAEQQKKQLALAQAQYGTPTTTGIALSPTRNAVSTAPSFSEYQASKPTQNTQNTQNSPYTQTTPSVVAPSTPAPTVTAPSNIPYTIGSDKGKEIAQNLGVGKTYTASDGSVWLKNSDGTITVNHKGNITPNAWVPTQATQPTTTPTTPTTTPTQTQPTATQPTPSAVQNPYVGVGTYNDAGLSAAEKEQIQIYKNIYNEAMARGDTATAEAAHSAAEAVRAKYNYSGGGDGSEYIPFPTQPTPTPSGIGSSDILSWNDNYNAENEQPTYTSKYDPQIEALLNEILNRDDFSYNAENDPLYQQYANIYQREGDRAMRNTLAEAAAFAGGMNSYAITAAQQAQNYYGSQLGDRMPELYQLAYEMYLQDKDSKVQDLGILEKLDDTQYGRYRDTMSDWRNDKSFAYGVYQDAVAQGNWEKTFDYNQQTDTRDFLYNDYWANREWNSTEQSTARDEVWNLIKLGVTPSADLIARAGMTQADVDNAVAAVKAGGSGNDQYYLDLTGGDNTGNGYIGNTGDTGTGGNNNGWNPENETGGTSGAEWTRGLSDLGLPMIYSAEFLVKLADVGGIYEKNGRLHWSDGWNADNCKEKLSNATALNPFGRFLN